MEPQRVVADARIKADDGLVALKYGPLIYNVEAADNQDIHRKLGVAPLGTEWRPDLLGGVMVISGKWADGANFVAIPNYARMNRVGPPPGYPGEHDANAGSAVAAGGKPPSSTDQRNRGPSVESKVWI